jgi:hypothetical protein
MEHDDFITPSLILPPDTLDPLSEARRMGCLIVDNVLAGDEISAGNASMASVLDKVRTRPCGF